MSGETWSTIRWGVIVAADFEKARVKVHFAELELTSDWLPVLQRGAHELADYWLPSVGDTVVCGFYSDASEEGCVIGSFYQAGDPPPVSGDRVYYTTFPDGSLVKWDNGELTITATTGATINADVTINGTVTINGSPVINGDLTVNGTVSAQNYVTI